MIENGSFRAGFAAEGILDFLKAKIEAQAAQDGAFAAAAEPLKARLELWSSTDMDVGYYTYGVDTNFTKGFQRAMETEYWKSYKYDSLRYEQAFVEVQAMGTESVARPQRLSYPGGETGAGTAIIFY